MKTEEAAIQQPLLSNDFANKHVCTATIGNSHRGVMFSVQSMPRCYKQDSQLKVDSWSNELVTGAYLERKAPTPVKMANLAAHLKHSNREIEAYPEKTDANQEEMKSIVEQQEVPKEDAVLVMTGALKD
jgi:hypothetical protein